MKWHITLLECSFEKPPQEIPLWDNHWHQREWWYSPLHFTVVNGGEVWNT